MTRTAAAAVGRQQKRVSGIPRLGSRVSKSRTSLSTVVKTTLQGRDTRKPQTKSVRFAGVRDRLSTASTKPQDKDGGASAVKNKHIDDDFVFQADPDALASILNNDGITREQLIKTQAAEAAQKKQTADEFLLVDGRPSLCRRVPVNRPSSILPDGRPSLISGRVSTGPLRVERPSVSGTGRMSFNKKWMSGQTFGRNSLYSLIEKKYSQRSQIEEPERRTTIATTAKQSIRYGPKQEKRSPLKNNTNQSERFEPCRVLSTKKVMPTTPAARVIVPVNPLLGSPALRVRKSAKKTPYKSRLAQVDSPEMKIDVAATLNFQDNENVSPNVQQKENRLTKEIKQTKALSRLRQPAQVNRPNSMGFKTTGGALTKSRFPPKNSDRYSFIKKAPNKAQKEKETPVQFVRVDLKRGEELVQPKTLNEPKKLSVQSNSKSIQPKKVGIQSPTVLNELEELSLSNKETIQPENDLQYNTRSKDACSIIEPSRFTLKPGKSKIKSPNTGIASRSRESSKRTTLDVDKVLEMMRQKMKSIKRRSVQSEFCSALNSIEKEMSLASVREQPEPDDTNIVDGHLDEQELRTSPSGTENSWRKVLKSDTSPTWKDVLKDDAMRCRTDYSNAEKKKSANSETEKNQQSVASPTWKDVLKKETAAKENLQPSLLTEKKVNTAKTLSAQSVQLGRQRIESSQKFCGGQAGNRYGNRGIELSVTKQKFMNIFNCNPAQSTRAPPVFSVNKFFDSVVSEGNTTEKATSSSCKNVGLKQTITDTMARHDVASNDPVSVLESQSADKMSRLEKSCNNKTHPNIKRERVLSGHSLLNSASNVSKETATLTHATTGGKISTASCVQGLETRPVMSSMASDMTANTVPVATCGGLVSGVLQDGGTLESQEFADRKYSSMNRSSLVRSPLERMPNSAEWLEKTPHHEKHGDEIKHTLTSSVMTRLKSSNHIEENVAKSVFWTEKTPATCRNSSSSKVSTYPPTLFTKSQSGTDECSLAQPNGLSNEFSLGTRGNTTTITTESDNSSQARQLKTYSDKPENAALQMNLHQPELATEVTSPQNYKNEVRAYEDQNENLDRGSSLNVEGAKIVDGVSWSDVGGVGKRKISSGRMGMDAQAMVDETVIDKGKVPVIRVFSPKTSPCSAPSAKSNERPASPFVQTSQTSFSNARETVTDDCQNSPNFIDQHRSSVLSHHCSRSAQQSVRFSDAVVNIVTPKSCCTSNVTPMFNDTCQSTDALKNKPEFLHLQSSTSHHGNKTTVDSVKYSNSFNSADLNLSFLESLHVVAIDTKKVDVANDEQINVPSMDKDCQQLEETKYASSKVTADNILSTELIELNNNVAAKDDVSCLSQVDANRHRPISHASQAHSALMSSSFHHHCAISSGGLASYVKEHYRTETECPIFQSSQHLTTSVLHLGNSECLKIDNGNCGSQDAVHRHIESSDTGIHETSLNTNILSGSKIAQASLSNKADGNGSLKDSNSLGSHIFPSQSYIDVNDNSFSRPPPMVASNTELIGTSMPPNFSLSGQSDSTAKFAAQDGTIEDFTAASSHVIVDNPSSSQAIPKPTPITLTIASHTDVDTISSSCVTPTSTQMKSGSIPYGGDDFMTKAHETGAASPLGVVVPKAMLPPPPQTPAAFRLLRRKLQESPIPKTFRSRSSNFKSPSRGGVRKTPQKRVRFLATSPSMKTLCSKRFAEALLDEEVALLTCRRFRSPGTPSKINRSRMVLNPLGRALIDGDDSHFVPISPMDKKSQSTAVGSAFSSFKQ